MYSNLSQIGIFRQQSSTQPGRLCTARQLKILLNQACHNTTNFYCMYKMRFSTRCSRDVGGVFAQRRPCAINVNSKPSLLSSSLARIIVGAPRGTAPSGAVDNTGLIYTCPVNPGTCSGLMGGSDPDDARLFDSAREC